MNKIKIQYFKTPFGELILGSFKDKLCLADWRYRKMRTTIDRRLKKGLDAEYSEENSKIIKQVIIQFNEYFEKKRFAFNIPLILVGTNFQKKVWQSLIKIPYGKVDSYLELSKKIGNKKAVRAVASANGANAISIIIPCHRIVGSNANLIGYAGGLETKNKLLRLEGYFFDEQLKIF